MELERPRAMVEVNQCMHGYTSRSCVHMPISAVPRYPVEDRMQSRKLELRELTCEGSSKDPIAAK